jgi:hypothetical protein
MRAPILRAAAFGGRAFFFLPLFLFWAGFALTALFAFCLAWYGAGLFLLRLLHSL